jgi:polysaccharide biosynthesis transport protein
VASLRDRSRLTVADAPGSPQAEQFRQLRTNLEFLRVADEQAGAASVVAVTSATAAEGKSTVASNLATALAETGARVLLVDADLRRPSVADVLGLEGGVGLTTVLAGQADVDDVVQEWGSAGLRVLPSGAVPPNPAELLGSPAMRRLIAELRARYDHVVVDTTPVLPVADASVLSRLVDGLVVVANARRVRRRQLIQGLGDLAQVSARVLGVVLNQVRRDEESYSYGPRAGAAPAAEAPARVAARAGKQPVG